MKSSKQSVDQIINQKTFAIVGVSRKKEKFGHNVFTEFRKKGLKVYPINPNASEIDGEKCYPNIKELPEKPDALIITVKPEETEKVVREAAEAGIINIWMQSGTESEEAIKFCKENNINEVHKECILMFMPPVESVHKFHRFFWKLFGQLPK